MHSRRYTAFISYRHADNTQEGRRWAEWLHRALERYVVPPDLIGTPNLRGEPIRDSLYPIFRDEDELPPCHWQRLVWLSRTISSAQLSAGCSPDEIA